ncbi:protein brown [Condylostylus longicornis]|uniref:protein brown n=1 Tax=Condylostylus longicornis TaxID=2530218 RepID=UPI00244DAF72|nr:protein brown [Condylostylus longicornis]XP_055374189.1 protein brown [Condylostylus longicornis]
MNKPELCLQWKDLEYSVPIKQDLRTRLKFWQCHRKPEELQILRPASGCLITGNLIAVLGPSGSGKTTLLAAISQRLRGSVNGDVLLNGLRIDQNEMTKISSFLPQYSISVRTLTAYEHLYFVSHFKMDKSTRTIDKKYRVNQILIKVGLKDCADTRIFHLSGGEKKRLSLAEELITDPPFIFCDEPTTGLDSYNAYSVIKTLRQLTQPGRKLKVSESSVSAFLESNNENIEMKIMTPQEESFHWSKSSGLDEDFRKQYAKGIICSIHQPTSEVFELFTHIVLISNGQILYQGSTDDAYIFFSKLGFYCPRNCNPADFYLKLITSDNGENKCNAIIKNNYEQEYDNCSRIEWEYFGPDSLNQVNNIRKISWFYQVYLLVKRIGIETRRNIKETITTAAFFMITSFTLAIMYSTVQGYNQITVSDITGSFFMISSEIIFTSSYAHVHEFSQLLPILRRETGEGTYSLSAYYMANVIALIPKPFIYSYLFFGVIYSIIKYSKGFLTYISMATTLSVSGLTAIAYGTFISSIFESEKMASEMAAPFDLVFLVFGGIYYNVNAVPLMKYISLFYFANEGLLYDYWSDVTDIDCPIQSSMPCVRNGTDVIIKYAFSTSPLTLIIDYFGLLALAIVFHAIAFFNVNRYVKKFGYY